MQHVSRALAEFTSGLRSRLIRNLFRANWSYLVQHSVGRMANLISGQASGAGRAYHVAATFFAQAVQTGAYLIVAFIVSWPLALAATGLGSLMVLSLHFLVRISRKAGWRQTQRSKELITLLVESLNSIKPLKAMAKEDEYATFLDRKIASLKKAIRTAGDQPGRAQERQRSRGDDLPRRRLLPGARRLGSPAGRARGGRRPAEADQQRHDQAAAAVPAGGGVGKPLPRGHGDDGRGDEAQELNPGTRPASFERECRLEKVSFAHGERQVLDQVSLQVPAGGVTVLIGPSGAGKTTIADMILGLYRPDRGRVLLDGVPLDEIDLRSWRRLIGYVPQELILLHDSVYANVALGNPGIDKADVADGRSRSPAPGASSKGCQSA